MHITTAGAPNTANKAAHITNATARNTASHSVPRISAGATQIVTGSTKSSENVAGLGGKRRRSRYFDENGPTGAAGLLCRASRPAVAAPATRPASRFPQAWRTSAAGGGERQRAFSDRLGMSRKNCNSASMQSCRNNNPSADVGARCDTAARTAFSPSPSTASYSCEFDGDARLLHLCQQIGMCARQHGDRARWRRTA